MRNSNRKLHRVVLFSLLLAAPAFSISMPFGGNGAAAAGQADAGPAAITNPAQVLLSTLGGPAAPQVPPHIFPPKGQTPQSPTQNASNLAYHGGPVMGNFAHNVYLIFWGTRWSYYYKALIEGYFMSIQNDSYAHRSSNVYYAATQYYRTDVSPTEHASYQQQLVAVYSDNTLAASGCTDTHGGTLRCYTDAQLQAEVFKAVHTNLWPMPADGQVNLNDIYFLFLGDDISQCKDSSCSQAFIADYCAYHEMALQQNRGFLFANMPYNGHNLRACGTGNYPNNDSAADSELSTASHEHNETITDPMGDGWYASNGDEDGDKCAWTFGTQLGGSAGRQYNQIINGAHYELQQEWSNHSSGCVTHGY